MTQALALVPKPEERGQAAPSTPLPLRPLMFGADPEFFLFSGPPGGRRFCPPHEWAIPHASEKWWKPADGHIFRDGWAVELNPRPTHSPHLLHYHVRNLIGEVENQLAPGKHLLPIPWVRIPRPKGPIPSDLLQFGCSPTLNAYGEESRTALADPFTLRFRSSGGHLHITTPAPPAPGIPLLQDEKFYPHIVRILDRTVGIALTYIFEQENRRSFARRSLYGRAGEFRVQHHGPYMGFEYRVPGPEMWAVGQSDILETICNLVQWIVEGEGFNRFIEEVWDIDTCAQTRNYINKGVRPRPHIVHTQALPLTRLEHYKSMARVWMGERGR